MKDKDIPYIEDDIRAIVNLYVEAYLMKKEKGFKTSEDRKSSQANMQNNISEVLEEVSEELNASIEEIIDILMKGIEVDKLSGKKDKYFAEEYSLLEEILQEISNNITVAKEKEEER